MFHSLIISQLFCGHPYLKSHEEDNKPSPIKIYAVPESGVDGRGQNLHYVENSFKDKIIQIHLYFFCNTFSGLKYKKVFFFSLRAASAQW